MAIKRIESTVVKVICKGVLKEINEAGIVIEDVKDGGVETLSFTEIKDLIGKEVNITIQNKIIEE